MKKKIIGGSFVIALAIVVSININLNKAENHTGDFTISSVEALGMCEVYSETGTLLLKCDGSGTCTHKLTGDGIQIIRCDGTKVAS